jgi:hypothetical protein
MGIDIGEESLNVMLAELLAERGLKALGEVILKKKGRRPEPDVLIELNGVRIIIEGKKPGMWNVLVKQCEERLDNGVCDLCVMVEYVDIKLEKLRPDQLDIKNALLKGKFNVGFMSYIDRVMLSHADKMGLGKWISGIPKPEKYVGISFDELLAHLMSAYTKVVSEDVIDPVIKRINEVLDEFATGVSTIVDIGRLKEVLELREKEEPDEQ